MSSLSSSIPRKKSCFQEFWSFNPHLNLPDGYGSIPLNTIFRGMNIHKSQLFCSPGVHTARCPSAPPVPGASCSPRARTMIPFKGNWTPESSMSCQASASSSQSLLLFGMLGPASKKAMGFSGESRNHPCLFKRLVYPLVNVYITMERSTMLLMGKSTISMAMFNSYVKLPEGSWLQVLARFPKRLTPLFLEAFL